MLKSRVILATVLGWCLLATQGHAINVTSSIIAGGTTIATGEQVTIRYSTESFPEFLGADLMFSFDAQVLSFSGATFGDFYLNGVMTTPSSGPLAVPAAASSGVETQMITFSRFFSGPVSGDVFLFDLTFIGAGPGTTTIAMRESPTAPFSNSTGNPFIPLVETVLFSQPQITVSGATGVIPLPASAVMLLGALAATAGAGRVARRKKAA